MKYCIRGTANVWGGHQVELLIEMVDWLKANCRTPYVVPKFDEAKFISRQDAERFARKWFEPGNWRLYEMGSHCRAACSHKAKAECSPLHGSFPVAVSPRRWTSLHHP